MDTITIRVDERTRDRLDKLLEAKQNEDRQRGGAVRSRSHVVRSLIDQAYILAAAKGEVHAPEMDFDE